MTLNSIFKTWYIIIILTAVSVQTVFSQTTLRKAGKYNPGICYGLALSNHFAYTTTNKSLIILDIQNPEKPDKVGELEVGVPIFGLSRKNNHVYLATSDKGLIIADVSDPTDPVIIGEYNSRGTMTKAEVIENVCIIIYHEIGIEIIDISNPANPQKIGGYQIGGRAMSIHEDIAYVSDPANGLTVLDISNPEKIKKLSIVENSAGAAGISINNDYLFLGSYNNWVRLYNISEPRSPKFITSYTYPNEISGLVATDQYLITNFQGITIEDITDVRNPIFMAEYHLRSVKGGVHGIVLRDNYIYFALKGITILKFEKD